MQVELGTLIYALMLIIYSLTAPGRFRAALGESYTVFPTN